MKKLRSVLINVALSLVSLFVLWGCLELLIFRFLLLAPDVPELDFVNGVVKYKPNQQGIYRVKDEIHAQYKINLNGWNSKYDRYDLSKIPNTYRIAIIGDSLVEAFQVDYDQSVAERLEERLGKEHFQIYRFGISGAPMSQYLQMLRKEVILYSPDLVMITLHHNDFDESYQGVPGVYTSSFLKINLKDGLISGENEPKPYSPSWYSGLKDTATWRYLAYRQKIQFQGLKELILGKRKAVDKVYQANIDISTLNVNRTKNEIITDYIFQQLQTICEAHGTKLLILMNGDLKSIQQNLDTTQLAKTGALSLNVMAQSVAQKRKIHFIDLQPVFQKDFAMRHHALNFQHDGHWNAYAHELIAQVIVEYIKQHFAFSG